MKTLEAGVQAEGVDVEATLCLRSMRTTDLDRVMAIEVASYAFPWTRGNFIDSLAADYAARLLLDADGEPLAYFVAMPGVDELHLLNITVAPAARGRGHASRLITALAGIGRARGAAQVWLEVRRSNQLAQSVYRHLGFDEVGVRKSYYPAPAGRREDAVLMSLKIGATDAEEPGHVD